MILIEVFLTALVIALVILGCVGWFTRPIWTSVWKRYRHEQQEEALRQQAMAEEEEHREKARAEVNQWCGVGRNGCRPNGAGPDEGRDNEETQENRR